MFPAKVRAVEVSQLEEFFTPFFLLLSTLVAMQCYGDTFNLFQTTVWYDKLMHVAGGALACVGVSWLETNVPKVEKFLPYEPVLVGLSSGLAVGLVWEVAEFFIPELRDSLPQEFWDTFFDLTFDAVGGYIAGWLHNNRTQVWSP